MPSTNGHGPKRVILYTRVSGEEQKKKGYSLDDQRDALRAWARDEGYEILEEVEDGAWSGGFLTRPGPDRVRELAANGGVHAVAALYRDRFARGIYTQLLAAELAEHGTRLIALNSQGRSVRGVVRPLSHRGLENGRGRWYCGPSRLVRQGLVLRGMLALALSRGGRSPRPTSCAARTGQRLRTHSAATRGGRIAWWSC